jgi:hypothetical protein
VPWQPTEEGEIPTLGWYVIDWMAENLAAPAKAEYEPFVLYAEQEDFVLKWYALDPVTGKFLYRRALIGRPRGWGKSPLLAALACCEALGDVVPAGWDANGQPVGMPWRRIKTPLVHIAAVSEEQTGNTWQPMIEMLTTEGPPVLDNYPGLDPFETIVKLPRRGSIQQITSSSRTTKGAPVTFGVLDQTEEWVPSNGGPKLANRIRTNAAKNGGRTVESPNAFVPGEDSVAEMSFAFAEAIAEGKSKVKTLLYDMREAPADTDMDDRESLTLGLRTSYGDSSGDPRGCILHDPPCAPGHVDLEILADEIWDLATDPEMAKLDYLNMVTKASDAWVDRPTWRACRGEAANGTLLETPAPNKTDPVVLGFDGSKGRAKGKADATALVAVRVRDGFAFTKTEWVWEQPDEWRPKVKGEVWAPDADEVDRVVRTAHADYHVVGFFADPSGWSDHVARWEAAFGKRYRVKATEKNPIAMWPRGKTTDAVGAVKDTWEAIQTAELTHNGHPVLERHVLNARMRAAHNGYLLYKAYPMSPKKIDAAYALTMAWKCRLKAVSKGIGRPRKTERTKQKVVVRT